MSVTDFVTWLADNGYEIARYGQRFDARVPCPACMQREAGRGGWGVAKVKGAAGLDISRLTARDKQILAMVNPEAGRLQEQLREQIPCPECDGKVWIYEQRVRDHVLQPCDPRDVIREWAARQ